MRCATREPCQEFGAFFPDRPMTCVPEGSHLSSPDHGRACRGPVPLGRSWPVPRAVVGYPTCGTRPPPLRTGSLLPTLAFEEASSANGASPPVCSTRPPFRRFPAPPLAPRRIDLMKITPWCLAALAPLAVAGYSGAFFGQVAVFAVTLGIFVGTLNLGRSSAPKLPATSPVVQVDQA